MQNNMDAEIHVENQLLESHLIDEIDANGCLVEEEFKNDIREDIEVDFGSEKYEDDIVDVNHEIVRDEADDVIGKVFETPNEAYEFYNHYALLHGFGIRIYSTYKNMITNEEYRKTYVCNKQGFKDLKRNTSGGTGFKYLKGNPKKRRRDLRTGCEARLQISKGKDGKWVIDMFNNAHNHEFTMSPNKVIKHRSHAKFHRSKICKSLMSGLGKSGLRPCQIKKVVNTIKTPSENDVTSKQCADILAEQRKHHKGKEFFGVIKHFQEKLIKDRNFYFSVDLFDDGSPRNIFWADGRSRDSYIKFSDVVVFDVTYKTNKFEMSFAPFIGVNHHGQSIIFGGALLENEKQETFEWLFNHFLECMFDKHPSAIITDQDKAICNAVKNIFPNTRHRYCSWHMKKHELEHLPSLTKRYNGLQELYREWVKSTTVEEFETRWKVINGQYNFERNCWMMELYNKRHLWAKVFLNDCFFAGMTTSGRSESIHSFFDDFVNSKTMLNEFVVQFDKAVEARREAEEDADFKTMNSKPTLYSVNPIEGKAGERYTQKMFEVFQKEWIEATNNLSHQTITKSSGEIQYKVGQVGVEKKYWRNVNFRLSNKVDVTCSCAKFETYGILCKHILYVMKKKHVESLPNHYILPRWTLDPRHKVDQVELPDIKSEDVVSSLTLWCLQSKFTKEVEQAKDSAIEIKRLESILVKFLEEQMIRVKHTESTNGSRDSNVGTSQVNIMPQISVRDPLVVTTTKGRPKAANRIKSSLEAPKKKKKCSNCQKLGHYRTGCPQKKVDDSPHII